MKTLTLEQAQKLMAENNGSLDLSGCTSLTALPEGLTVGGGLYLSGCTISNPKSYQKLKNGDYIPGRYLYADGILTHVKGVKIIDKYTYFIGKIKDQNVIFDGVNYAHCINFREGVADLNFKSAKERGTDQFKHYTLDSVVKTEEAITMYRLITGACKAGTAQFLERFKELKEEYSVREIIELTKGHYGSGTFESFFKSKEERE